MREKLIREISNADEELLRVVDDIIDGYNAIDQKIVSEPMSMEQYNKRIEIAEEDIANGDVFTQEEVVAMFEKKWKKR